MNGIWHLKKSPAHNEQRQKKERWRRELLNQESTKILGGKENYKYWGKLEVETIKQAGMKEKRKHFLKRKNFSKPTSLTEILSSG